MSCVEPAQNDMTDAAIADERDRALAWFAKHRDEYVADLLDWVRVSSVSDVTLAEEGKPYGPGVAAMFDKCAETAARYGLKSTMYDGVAMSVFAADAEPEGDDIAMVSHLDVVPAGPGWLSEPFEPYERDGFVIGRGADDNKACALADIYLMRYLVETGSPLVSRLRVLYGGAEETGLEDMRTYVAKHGAPFQAVVTDCGFPVNTAQKGELEVTMSLPASACLAALEGGAALNAVPGHAEASVYDNTVAEGASLSCEGVELSHEADGQTKLVATGVPGHAAFPGGTRSALGMLWGALVQLCGESAQTEAAADRGFFEALSQAAMHPYGEGFGVAYEDQQSGQTTTNIGTARLENGRLIIGIDIRHAVTQQPDDILAGLKTFAANLGGEVTAAKASAPYAVAEDDPRVTLLTDVCNRVLGGELKPYAMGGGTHARVIPNAVNFGPGIDVNGLGRADEFPCPDFLPAGSGAHGANEWASVDRIAQAFAVYAVAMPRLAELVRR